MKQIRLKLVLIGLAIVLAGAVLIPRISEPEPLSSGPLNIYVASQIGTRAQGCAEVDPTQDVAIYLNAFHISDPPADGPDVSIVGIEVLTEPFVSVQQEVLVTHPDQFAPNFAPTSSEIFRGYDLQELPRSLTASGALAEVVSIGVVATFDQSLVPVTSGEPEASVAFTIEAVLYENTEGDRFRAEVHREMAIVFSETPLDIGLACANVTEDF